MKKNDNFATQSLELHLFFGRVMKEHSLFLMAGFLPPDAVLAKKADWFRQQFEDLLRQTVRLSDGAVSPEVLESGEIVTDFTEKAERSTSRLTGIPIETRITQDEKALRAGCGWMENSQLRQQVRALNERALKLTDGLITFKEELLDRVSSCRTFTANYPLLIRHIIREAKQYRMMTELVNENGCLSGSDMWSMEVFWNRIMMEHALFIRGLLDPSQEELILAADDFAREYRMLLQEASERNWETMDALTRQTLAETVKYRDFKAAGTEGILQCRIASIILPLLADHVLREANHYLRLLQYGLKGR